MSKFRIYFTERVTYSKVVEADSYEDACVIADEQVNNGLEIIDRSTDIYDVYDAECDHIEEIG